MMYNLCISALSNFNVFLNITILNILNIPDVPSTNEINVQAYFLEQLSAFVLSTLSRYKVNLDFLQEHLETGGCRKIYPTSANICIHIAQNGFLFD